MGIALVEGRDLLVHDNVVYMRTTAGLRRVDVIYRRVDDDFLDPLAFRRRLAPGRRRACSTPIAPATCRSPTPSAPASPTTRRSTPTCRRSSGSTCREEPILHERRDLSAAQRRRTASYVLEHLDSLVVKAVGESGGYGMLIGPHSTAREREEFRGADPGRPAQLHRAADAGALARALLHRRAASSRGTSTCGRTSCTARRSRSCRAG